MTICVAPSKNSHRNHQKLIIRAGFRAEAKSGFSLVNIKNHGPAETLIEFVLKEKNTCFWQILVFQCLQKQERDVFFLISYILENKSLSYLLIYISNFSCQ
jgi:hypothetical protein